MVKTSFNRNVLFMLPLNPMKIKKLAPIAIPLKNIYSYYAKSVVTRWTIYVFCNEKIYALSILYYRC